MVENPQPMAGSTATAAPRPSFGEWLRRQRRTLDLTQAELADRVGCARVTIRKLEAEELRPSKQLAGALAEQLGIPAPEREAFIRYARSGESEAPALSQPAAWNAPSRFANLPLKPNLGELFGREREIATLQAWLDPKSSRRRLVTLTGVGGVGKTTLAIETAAGLLTWFEHGVAWVDLTPLRDPRLVPAAIAHALGLQERGQQPLGEIVKQALQARALLLVLDNFEQVVSAAPFIADLVASCPRLALLVTSREPLRIRGEHQFPVRPLASDAAVELFVARARDLDPEFSIGPATRPVILELCNRLDHLPLAIELAAAQTRMLTPPEILARLNNHLALPAAGARDLPERQRTMAAAIGWSYSLLSADEQVLLRRLSVFRGGFSVEAAEALADALATPQARTRVLDGLGQLVEKSLLQTEEHEGATRYRLFETIREYAGDRLAESGEQAQVHTAHLAYFLQLARAAERPLLGPEQIAWKKRLDLEIDNLRAAVDWARQSDAVKEGLELISSAMMFWVIRGNWSEAKEWVMSLLPRLAPASPDDLSVRARACLTAGVMANRMGDRTALSLLEESIVLARQTGAEGARVLAFAQACQVVATLFIQGDFTKARAIADQALESARASGDPWLVFNALNNLGLALISHGEYKQAATALETSLAFAQQVGDGRAAAVTRSNLGWALGKQGEYSAARAYLEETRAVTERIGETYVHMQTLLMLGDIALAEGDDGQAWTLFEECHRRWLDLGINHGGSLIGMGRVRLLQGNLEMARSMLEEGLRQAREFNKLDALPGLTALARLHIWNHASDQAETLLREALELLRHVGGPEYVAACLELFGEIATSQDQMVRAARLFGAAESLRISAHVPMPANERQEYVDGVAAARAHLRAKFKAEQQIGGGLALEQAIALALGEKA